ncbi:MAG: MFS transporter [candidate division Zixibacteria bacterium]|nr:MFS transporter [candidate division Zixibacteria bacterium]
MPEMHRPHKVYSLQSVSWGLYDLANTIFSMNVVSLYFALWVVEDLGGDDLMVAAARSSAMLLIAVTMPFLGALSDFSGKRKPLILLFTIICVGFTAVLAFDASLIVYLLFFGIAVFGFQAGLVFYNALLPDVSPPGKEGKVSGMGVALGYVGSIAGMLAIRPFVGTGAEFSRQAAFLPTAVLFLIFAIPLFLFVKEKRIVEKRPMPPVKELFLQPYRIFKSSSGFPSVRRFLIGRFFVVEAMETVISFMAVFVVFVGGFNQKRTVAAGMDEVMFFMVIATVFAVIGSFIWGIAADRIGAAKALKLCVLLWVVTLFIALVNPLKELFWLVGPLAGIGLGGVWTTDRAWLINTVPLERRAEFFGLYALSGRLAAVIGPLLWGISVRFGEPLGDFKYRIAVGTIFLLMLIGYLILLRLPPEGRDV